MKTSMIKLAATAFVGAAMTASPLVTAPALAADPIYMQPPSNECGDQRLLNRIVSRFDIQAREVHRTPELQIAALNEIYETRFQPQYSLDGSPIARRYCKGQAYMSDGQQRSIWYLMEYGAGFAGVGNSVEFCISGLDRWNVYGANCSVLR